MAASHRQARWAHLLGIGGSGLLMAAPVFVYSARLTSWAWIRTLYGLAGAMALVLGLAAFVAAPVLAWKGNVKITWLPLLLFASLAISLGGLILALAEDYTIFLATLVSTIFALVVSSYNRILAGDRPSRKTVRASAPGGRSTVRRRK